MTLRTLVSLFGPHWDEHCNSQDMETVTDCYRKTVRHNLRQVSPEASVPAKEGAWHGGGVEPGQSLQAQISSAVLE